MKISSVKWPIVRPTVCLSHASHSGNTSDSSHLDSLSSGWGMRKFSNVVPPFLWEVLKGARASRIIIMEEDEKVSVCMTRIVQGAASK